MRRFAIIAAAMILAAAGARAETPIASAGGADRAGAPEVPSETAPKSLADPDQLARDDRGPLIGPCGPTVPDRKDPEKPDHKAHGEVFAGVGTHGYRELGGAVCQPLGDNAALSIDVRAAHIDGWRRR